MNALSRESVQLHCRTCLCDLQTKVDEIGLPRQWYHLQTTEKLADWIQNFTSLRVLEANQEYPQFVCQECYEKFRDFHDFQELVWKAAVKLDSLLQMEANSRVAAATGIHQMDAERSFEKIIKTELPCSDNADDLNDFLNENSAQTEIKLPEKFEPFDSNSVSTNADGPEDCDEEFNEQAIFDDETPKSTMSYKCDQCNRSYAFKYTYEAHIRQDHQGIARAFQCEHCQKRYTKFCNLYRHMRQEHNMPARQFKCEYPDCKRSFRQLLTRRKHYQEFHQRLKRPPTPPTPPDSTLLLPELLLTADLPPLTPKRFTCTICPEQYETLYNLQNHMLSHREAMKYVCSICGKRKISQLKLDEHYATVHDPKNAYPCTICHKIFKCKSHVSVHIMSVHKGIRPYACHYCPMQFAARNTLKIHERLHTGEKPFACEICGRRFTQLTPMKKHRLTHEKERNQPQLPPTMLLSNFGATGN